MIAINLNGQIRVWANDNFGINAIDAGKKLHSENQMVQSLYKTMICHVGGEYKKSFTECCGHIGQAYRLTDAKNKFSSLTANINKKTLLQELIRK